MDVLIVALLVALLLERYGACMSTELLVLSSPEHGFYRLARISLPQPLTGILQLFIVLRHAG